jgi:hypothetical protein
MLKGVFATRRTVFAGSEGSLGATSASYTEAAGRGPTLALLADMLVSRGCEGALNLDGGPSMGVAWRQAGQVRALSPCGPLRHAIAVWVPPRGE